MLASDVSRQGDKKKNDQIISGNGMSSLGDGTSAESYMTRRNQP